ncbi:uncharacterized protein LOC121048549 [Ixodes scapularis]|uniref:uncharacterized protein LOC121048549 n=1 Tax=Ixodes scapularis TaxID=6945 RepID=UPI001C393F3E|nr:uncharacterized protein LOC121048549 [Ixodes scapularis]
MYKVGTSTKTGNQFMSLTKKAITPPKPQGPKKLDMCYDFHVNEDFTVLEPFEGETLYLKIDITRPSPSTVYKIYDEDFECENAKELLEKDTETRPILLYECYQSGNSIDAPGTSNFTLLYDGTSKITKAREGATWSATKGSTESYVVGTLFVLYNEERSFGAMFSFDGVMYFTVLEPFEGETLYLKIDIMSPSHVILYKIFDEDFECENAKELLKKDLILWVE